MQGKKLISRLGLAGLSVAILLGCGYALLCNWLYNSEARRFWRMYEQLEIGMSYEEVQSLFGREPEYECSYADCKVVYFFRNGITDSYDSYPLDDFPQRVDSKKHIPSIYAAGQLLFTPDNELAAFTVNGESYRIFTPDGEIPGSSLSLLDDIYFTTHDPNYRVQPSP